eukprot:TRINITY_DN3231_c0_g1_i1.p1 TRINITY_DN3231_c0_g1~~TRINITY_DN3231_c0_g1_i1.p1  ORF type:complete len:525 (-),score=160.88 TRINITY_DN3231_c0_g1_i1:95-1435(-)
MTDVQQKGIPVALTGADAFVKAKTGTGKTLAFLIPAFEKMASNHLSNGTQVLIIAPTRELVDQIISEAQMVNSNFNYKIKKLIGGKPILQDQKAVGRDGPFEIVVATPGRLKQLLIEDPVFKRQLSSLKMLVLDEGDTLLDMGFQLDIMRIMGHLPKERQTVLYSATLPQKVLDFARGILRPNNVLVDSVGKVVDQTHQHVEQSMVVTDMTQQYQALEKVIHNHLTEEKEAKILVFLPTARETGLVAGLFQEYKPLQMHSKLSQSARDRTAREFRMPGSHLMFSSDVSARGMDYPNITMIVQVGHVLRDQYVQRLGRTARAGKSGKGVLILADYEEKTVMKELNGISIKRIPFSADDGATKSKLRFSIVEKDATLKATAKQAYKAWLGYRKSFAGPLGFSPAQLVQKANEYSSYIGLREVPALQKKTIGMMGLKGVPGLVIEEAQR